MMDQINGLHHVTSMAKDAVANNRFFTRTLGLRRVKKTVNFDAPDVYHLYYGDRTGTPGSVMTYFPFPNIAPHRQGSGEVGSVVFAVPEGALGFWADRLQNEGISAVAREDPFGEKRLAFEGPDREALVLVETVGDLRTLWKEGGIAGSEAIRGFHSVSLRLADGHATEDLLHLMGYREVGRAEGVTRLALPSGNGAGVVDIQSAPGLPSGRQGAGSVHHVAFSVKDGAAQLEVRRILTGEGHDVTPVIDRDYFDAIYFRSPGGVLFEVATDEPGFLRDEAERHLGEGLMLPQQHARRRALLEASLQPLED